MTATDRPRFRLIAAGTAGAAILFVACRMLLARRLPLFNDEAIYLGWLGEIVAGRATPLVSLAIGKEPLFPAWLWPFGLIHPDLMTAGRLGALAAGTLGAVFAWRLGRRLGGPVTGMLALMFVAVNPYLMIHESMAMYESLSTALELGWLYCLVRASEPDETRPMTWALAAGLFWSAGIFHKDYFQLLAPAVALVLIAQWRRNRRAGRDAGALVALRPVLISGACALAAVPLLHSLPGGGAITPETSSLVNSWREMVAHPGTLVADQVRLLGPSFLFYFPLPGFLLIPAALRDGDARVQSAVRGILWLWLGVSLPGFLLARTGFSRHIHLGYPLLIMAAACGWPALRSRAARAAAGVLVLAEVVTGIQAAFAPAGGWRLQALDRYQYVTGWPAGWGLPELARFIKEERVDRPIAIIGEHILSLGLPLAAHGDPTPPMHALAHVAGVPSPQDVAPYDYFLFNHNWPAPIPPDWTPVFSYVKPGGVSRMVLYRIQNRIGRRTPATPRIR